MRGVYCLALAYAFANSLELFPCRLFMNLAQAIMPAQNHEHTHWSLFMTLAQAVKLIILAGPLVLLSSAWQS